MTDKQLFNSKRWEMLRARVLRRDEYLDQVLLRYGKRITADTVHHALPREVFPEYAFCSWNCVSVSRDTHNKLHDRDGHYLTDEGMKLLERIARKNNINISEKEKLRLIPPG